MRDVPYITRDVMPVRSWHLRILLLNACFQPQNGHSKAQNDHHFSDLFCSIIHLAWRPHFRRGLLHAGFNRRFQDVPLSYTVYGIHIKSLFVLVLLQAQR